MCSMHKTDDYGEGIEMTKSCGYPLISIAVARRIECGVPGRSAG